MHQFKDVGHILAYNLSDYLKQDNLSFLNINRDLYKERVNFLLEKLSFKGSNEKIIKEILQRLRLRLLKFSAFALTESETQELEVILDNLNRAIDFKNHIISRENLISFLILKIGVLLRLQRFEKTHSMFLQNNYPLHLKIDVMIALKPIITKENFNAIINEGFRALNKIKNQQLTVKWLWKIIGEICDSEDGKDLLLSLTKSLSHNPRTETLNAIEGLCQNSNILSEFQNYSFESLLFAANFEPRAKIARRIIVSFTQKFPDEVPAHYINFLSDKCNEKEYRKYSLFLLEALSEVAPSLFHDIEQIKNRLFGLLNADLFREEYKSILTILLNLSKNYPVIKTAIDDYTNNLLTKRPTLKQLDLLLLNAEFLPADKTDAFINLLLKIIQPQNLLDRFFNSYYNQTYKQKALSLFIQLAKNNTKPIKWLRNPVEIMLNNLNHEPSNLRELYAEGLNVFALKDPALFSDRDFSIILHKANNYYTNILPALGTLIKTNEQAREKITSEFFFKLLQIYINIGSFFINAQKIEKPIISILQSESNIINISHLDLLITNFNHAYPHKILEFFLLSYSKTNIVLSENYLRKIEERLNALLHDPWNLNHLLKPIVLLINTNIFPIERLASFFVFHLNNNYLLSKSISLFGLTQLLLKEDKEFINTNDHYLKKIIEKLEDENAFIRLLAFTSLYKFSFNPLVKEHLYSFENKYINLIKDSLIPVPDSLNPNEVQSIENHNLEKLAQANLFAILEQSINQDDYSNIQLSNLYSLYETIKPNNEISSIKNRNCFFTSATSKKDSFTNTYDSNMEESTSFNAQKNLII